MRKYLELFKDGFDETLAEKIKPENWPYVGYSLSEGISFTVIPEPVVGPADNEIWYKTSDNQKGMFSDYYYGSNETRTYGVPGDEGFIDWHDDYNNVYNVISHEYNPQTGYIVIKFDKALIGTCLFWWSIAAYGGMPSSSFGRTHQLIEVLLPTNIKHIGIDFCSDSGITSITIPNSVTSIGSFSFYNCISLTSITFEGTMEEWNAITKGNNWNGGLGGYVPATYVQCSDGQVTL